MSAVFVTRQDSDLEPFGQLWKVYELAHSLADDLSLASLRRNLESIEHFDMRDDIAMDLFHEGLNFKGYSPALDQYEEVHDVVIEALKDRNLEIAKQEEEAINQELANMIQGQNQI